MFNCRISTALIRDDLRFCLPKKLKKPDSTSISYPRPRNLLQNIQILNLSQKSAYLPPKTPPKILKLFVLPELEEQ